MAAFAYRPVPDAPAIEAPALGDAAIDFHWQDAGPGMQYRFQLDTDPEFPAPVIDQSTDQPQVTIERPEARAYYFRVQAIDDTG